MLDSFADIRADIDTRLIAAATDRRSPMHTPVVGTADADLRVMVLRDFDPKTRTLRFHTDSRAPKTSVADGAPVGVLFYDKAEKLQIRCRGEGQLARTGEMVDEAWQASSNFARRCYLGEEPGAASDTPTSGLPPQFEGSEPSDAQLIPARDNFALLLVSVASFDWFSLAHTGHRRAVFDGDGARWVSP